jgi:hypothetical protein
MAARAAGIGVSTFMRYMQRGRDEEEHRAAGGEPDSDEQVFLDLWQKIDEARATAGTRSVLLIQKVAQGGQVIEETTRTYRDHDGQVVTEKTVKRTAPDWRAAAWMLERQHR